MVMDGDLEIMETRGIEKNLSSKSTVLTDSPLINCEKPFGADTAWEELRNASSAGMNDNNKYDQILDSEDRENVEDCGHLTSHCCLPEVPDINLDEGGSSRSSTDSGVMMMPKNTVANEIMKNVPASTLVGLSYTADIKPRLEDGLNMIEVNAINVLENSSTANDENVNAMHKQSSTEKNLQEKWEQLPPVGFKITNENGTEAKAPLTSETNLIDALRIPEDYASLKNLKVNDCTNLEFTADKIATLVGCPVLKNVIESRPPIDTVISCAGGKIGSHRVVLASASPFIEELLLDHKLGEVATLILPDISVKVMEILLQLCYTGQMVFPQILENEVYEAMELLMIGILGQLSLKKITVKLRPPPILATVPPSPEKPISPVPTVPSPVHASTSLNPEDSEGKEEIQSKQSNTRSEPVPSTSKSAVQKIPGAATLLLEGRLKCSRCRTVWSSKLPFHRHLMKVHKKKFHCSDIHPTELNTLSYCPICDKHHKTTTLAGKCLKAHNLSKCWTCLGTFSDIMTHYRKAHGINTEDGLIIKCRWCDLMLCPTNKSTIVKHSLTHLNLPNKPEISHLKRPEDANPRIQSILPFLTQYTDNLANATEKPHHSTSLSMNRKLDENGKPLQLARRTGVSIGRVKTRIMLLRSMRFNQGVFPMKTDKTNGKVSGVKILQLPEVHIHLDLMSPLEIDRQLFKRHSQDVLHTDKDAEITVKKIKHTPTTPEFLDEEMTSVLQTVPEKLRNEEEISNGFCQEYVNSLSFQHTVGTENLNASERVGLPLHNELNDHPYKTGNENEDKNSADQIRVSEPESSTQFVGEGKNDATVRQENVQILKESGPSKNNSLFRFPFVMQEDNCDMDTEEVSIDNKQLIDIDTDVPEFSD